MESDIPGPSLLSSSTQQSSAKALPASNTSQAPSGFVEVPPNYNPFASQTTSRSSSIQGPSLIHSQPAQLPRTSSSSQPSQSDPFAILATPPPPQPSPRIGGPPSTLTHPSSSPSIFNFAPSAPAMKSPSPASAPLQRSNGATADDDWNFASALPEDNTKLPSANDLTLSRTPVTIAFKISRSDQSDSVVSILANSSNSTDHVITDYTFLLAVKVGSSIFVAG